MKSELNLQYNRNDTEVDLFRRMKDILENNYNVAFIEETHKHYVKFQSATLMQEIRKEISDLWIIVFSRKRAKARMTFLQAKYEKRNDLNSTHCFYGDYFQYELLNKRPEITNVGKRFDLPKDALSFSCCSSVGSFGVFFMDSNNQLDLAYCSASQLDNRSRIPANKKNNRVKFGIPSGPTNLRSCDCKICSELLSCIGIDIFTCKLIGLDIGAELTANHIMLNQIKGLLAPFRNEYPAVSDFLNFGGDPPEDYDESIKKSKRSSIKCLVINADSKG